MEYAKWGVYFLVVATKVDSIRHRSRLERFSPDLKELNELFMHLSADMVDCAVANHYGGGLIDWPTRILSHEAFGQ